MPRLIRRHLVSFILLALAAGACGSSSSSSTTTTTAPTATTTDTFSGTLTLNGGASYPFAAVSAGSVVATLTSVGPDPSATIGISMGTWNGSVCTVNTGLFIDLASQGTVLSGSVSTASSLCVRVYDSAAKITTPVTYTITVVHP
jgi:hypothetical protein